MKRSLRMTGTVAAVLIAACLLASALLPTAPALASPLPQTLEGRWRLVEQYRGSGQANLAAEGPPLHLEFARGESGLAARVWSGDDPSSAAPWLAVVADCGPVPVTVNELVVLAGERGVRARYRLSPPGEEGSTLEITEQYAIAEGGRALAGTVRVTALKGGEDQGTYVLRRRFEREP